MNIERIQTVRDFIAAHRYSFQYAFVWGKEGCGSVGCVAGHTNMLFIENAYEDNKYCSMQDAANILELSAEEQGWLFVPWEDLYEDIFDACDVEEALRRLDWLIEHATIEGYTSPILGLTLQTD